MQSYVFFLLNHLSTMNFVQSVKDFLSLIYPRGCGVCSQSLVNGESCICSACWYELPKTGFYRDKENPMTRIFWGRIDIVSGTALFHYQKGGKVQDLIHRLKYKGQQEIGRYLGMRLGHYMLESSIYRHLDSIIPVPLHPEKQRMRGFNQSEAFGEGLSRILGVPLNTRVLQRLSATSSQTRKRRFMRWENVESAFSLNNTSILENKHVLLVDDVITTGATMEACANKLLTAAGVKVYLASIGVTV
jgi:ComF family protein